MRTEAISGIVRFLAEHLTFIVLVIATAFVTSCILLVLNQKNAADLFRQAQEQIGTNQPRAAAETLRAIEREYPHWERMAEVYYLQGNLQYFHENNLYGAMELWQRTLAADPATPDFEIHRRFAEIHPERHRRPAAGRGGVEISHRPLSGARRHPALSSRAGPLLRQVGSAGGGDHRAEEPPGDGGRSPYPACEATIQLAMIYYNQKNYQRARDFLEPVTQNPTATTAATWR